MKNLNIESTSWFHATGFNLNYYNHHHYFAVIHVQFLGHSEMEPVWYPIFWLRHPEKAPF